MNIIILIIFSILLFMLLNNSDKKCESFIPSSKEYCENKKCTYTSSGCSC